MALAEQASRLQAALAAQAEERIREATREDQRQLMYAQATAARLARESSPAYQAKINNQALRARYGIKCFVERHHLDRLMRLLKRVAADQRLDEQDGVWLSTEGEEYFTAELRRAYHRLEADFFASRFRQTRDPWAAVNASSHYRTCRCPRDAEAILSTITIERQPSKIQAALCTTYGGVMRDLKRWDEAIHLGPRAHALQPADYRPCTLLGALYMETGQHALGNVWYNNAIARGASVDGVDRDIRTILTRLTQSQRSALEDFLRQEDPTRFVWVQKR